MKGRIVNFICGRLMKKQQLTIEIEEDFSPFYDELKDAIIEFTFEKWFPLRKKNANAYFWELCGKLAAKLRQPKEQIYRFYCRDIGDNYYTFELPTEAVEGFDRVWKTGDKKKKRIGWFTEEMSSPQKGMSTVLAYFGSSLFTTPQMSRLIDMVIEDCKENGIETKTPNEIAEMLSLWENAR